MDNILDKLIKSRKTQRVDFQWAIAFVSNGQEVISIDLKNEDHKILIARLSSILKEILKESENKGGIIFNPGDNIPTIVNAWLAERIQDKLKNRSNLFMVSSKWSGYPRFIISSNFGDIYLTIKTTRVKKSSSRTFYVSSTKSTNIKSKGFHISILMNYDLLSEEDIPIVYVKSFEISDLSKIFLSMKLEFNASTLDLETGNLKKIE